MWIDGYIVWNVIVWVNRLVERDKLDVTVLCLEGEVLDWYYRKEDRTKISSWAKLGKIHVD